MTEFSIEELLWDAVIGHAGDVACPSQLSLAHGGGDAREVCLFQDLCVGDFVLPADVEKIAEASEVEMVQLFFMPSVRGPGFRAVE